MISLRLRGIALAFGPLLMAVTALFAPVSAQAQENAPLFINLTNDDPWKASMAAFFATNFALKQGHKPVVIFVNVQATSLFSKSKADVRSEQFGRTVHDMYREFSAAGGKVLVCPVCMKAIGIKEGDLIDGAEVATIKSVNDVLFRPDAKTMAW